MTTITHILTQMGFMADKPAIPIANYVQTKQLNSTLYISGQLPIESGKITSFGKASDVELDKSKHAAKLCAVNLLSQLASAVDDKPEFVKSCIKLEIFVNSEAGFERLTDIADVASELIVKVLGEKGKHARVTIGVPSLPLNATVEISGTFEIIEDK